MLVLGSSVLSVRGQIVGSVASRISYTETEGGLVGLIKVDAQPVLGTSFAINMSSALQWDLHTQNAGWMSLTSDAARVSAPANLNSNQLLQPKPLWALSSTGEYNKETFWATASETLSNSLVDVIGQYSFNGFRNWCVNLLLIPFCYFLCFIYLIFIVF